MRLEERFHRRTGMIASAILNDHHMLPRLLQHIEQNRRVAFGIESTLMRFVEKPAGEIVNQAKDFVAFALATGGDFGLLALGSLGIAERAPLGKPGFISKSRSAFCCLGWCKISGHFVRRHSRRLASLRGSDKTRFLIGKAQILEQGGQIVRMIRHAKTVLDEVLNHRRIPTA